MSTRSTCFTSEVLSLNKLSPLLFSALSTFWRAGEFKENEGRLWMFSYIRITLLRWPLMDFLIIGRGGPSKYLAMGYSLYVQI